MKFLILSDPHANWHALEAVLAEAKGGYDQVVCCGDLVGYNAQPAVLVDWTRTNCQATVRGNHDKAAAGLEDLTWFNDVAQAAIRWSVEQLDEKQMRFLVELPKGPIKLEHFHLWHGAPQDEDEYVTSAYEASACFAHFDLPLAFFGHTHLQGGFFMAGRRVGGLPPVRADREERVIELDPDCSYMVNPGSVGQPRDGDPRAGYALYDSVQRTVTLRRAMYPVAKAAEDIVQAGLPDALALRLFQGS